MVFHVCFLGVFFRDLPPQCHLASTSQASRCWKILPCSQTAQPTASPCIGHPDLSTCAAATCDVHRWVFFFVISSWMFFNMRRKWQQLCWEWWEWWILWFYGNILKLEHVCHLVVYWRRTMTRNLHTKSIIFKHHVGRWVCAQKLFWGKEYRETWLNAPCHYWKHLSPVVFSHQQDMMQYSVLWLEHGNWKNPSFINSSLSFPSWTCTFYTLR